jgi:hypothetical protein
MKFVLTCLSLLVSNVAIAQSTPCDSISWQSNRKLTWDDFKQTPDANKPNTSLTHYNFAHRWAAHGFTLTTKMSCFFSPCLSWSKNKSSSNLLRHEQGHFDIAEYFRRVYNKRILEATYSPKTLSLIMKKTYTDINIECLNIEDQYDKETDYSRNFDKQTEWEKKIGLLLESMKEYDISEVKVSLARF